MRSGNMDGINIYNHSPIWVQNILTTVKGFSLKRKRYNKDYKKALKEYLERDYSDYRNLLDYQWERTEELVNYAYQNSPFYQEFYDGIDLKEVIKKRDITLLPVLEKEYVRENISKMYSIPEKEAFKSNTSGTTGKSICFWYSKKDLQRRMAYLDAFKIKNGFVPMKMKRASFNSAKIVPPNQKKNVFWRDNLSIKQRIYSGYHCKGDNLKYYIDNIIKYRPASIDGYPSAIYELAKYINDNSIELKFSPVAIFPTAETLLPFQKEAIENAFGCPVYNQYASSEGAPYVVGCKASKLHYCMDTGIIEFLDNGEVLVTCFETHGTPLIRYRIGDKMFLSKEHKCTCGIDMPIVASIEGRNSDYILSKQNGKVTAVFLSLVSEEFLNSIKEMQYIQNTIDTVDVYIVVDENYNESMNEIIMKKLHYSLGDDMEINIHKVPELHKEKSGKCRFIINNLGRE